ncbi:XdhC family protein [Helicovermis profundi]|uniref:XdhC/CoxI family protein n=1 Tax=Helicovermis profundi TaxID=3065157 RepID=A0AAU9EDM5_9FIRM|nr:XdhC/CoxI family protein [Clostridia bacterium S502]
MSIYYKISEMIKENKKFAVATIIESKGSTPAHAGKMIINSDGSIIGTIGGGLAEKYVINESISAIKEDSSKIVEYTLNNAKEGGLDMLCGGDLKVFIEVNNIRPTLVLIGGGHVNYAISKLVDFLKFDLIVVEDRKEFCNKERYPFAKKLYNDFDMEKSLKNLVTDSNTYIVIATRDGDEMALREIIEKESAYIGVIGSKRKVKVVLNNIAKDGVKKELIDKVCAPIGLDIGSNSPEEIAISIISEILMIKNGGSARQMKEVKK